MWRHPKLKNNYIGNYEYLPSSDSSKATRILRLENRGKSGQTIGKVYTFSSPEAAKEAGWKYQE